MLLKYIEKKLLFCIKSKGFSRFFALESKMIMIYKTILALLGRGQASKGGI